MPFIPTLGQSDFRKLRESGAGYVDKTAFISELLADPAEVLLFPRPRRFGKTLFLSTLACFLERSDTNLSHLFQDLAIWSDPAARAHFQQHPVIFLTLKDIKTRSYAQPNSSPQAQRQSMSCARCSTASVRGCAPWTRSSRPRREL